MPLNTHRAVIWTPYSTGHHPAYSEQIIRAMYSSGFSSVVIFSPLHRHEYIQMFPNLISSFYRKSAPNVVFKPCQNFSSFPASSPIAHLCQAFILLRIIILYRPRVLVIPYADSLFLFLPIVSLIQMLFNGGSTTAIWMRLQSHIPSLSFGKVLVERIKTFYLFLLTAMCKTYNFTPDICAYCNSSHGNNSILHYLPERVIPSKYSVVESRLPENRSEPFRLLVFGDISERKCISKLLNLSDHHRNHLSICAVGKHSDSALGSLMSLEKSRVHCINKYVSDETLIKYIQYSDALWCVQSSHNLSSSAVANAIYHGKILIYECGYYICTIAKTYNKSIHLHELLATNSGLPWRLRDIDPSLDKSLLPCQPHQIFAADWSDTFALQRNFT